MPALGILQVSTVPIPEPVIRWSSMSEERFAALEFATGSKLAKFDGMWWHQVRPSFFRPLLPYKRFDPRTFRPRFSATRTLQYGVAEGHASNSYLNPIVFEEPWRYEAGILRYSVQKQIRKAYKNGVTVSRIEDVAEFVERAYPCYLSFYERTKYAFGSSRRRKEGFADWADRLFQFPEVVVLGAFLREELLSFEIACMVEDRLVLKTLVNADKALQVGAPDLLLHTYRKSVREEPRIKEIYDSLLGQRAGINDFYLVRGARVLAVPALLNINPTVKWLLQRTGSGVYRRLLGLSENSLPNCRGTAGEQGQAAIA